MGSWTHWENLACVANIYIQSHKGNREGLWSAVPVVTIDVGHCSWFISAFQKQECPPSSSLLFSFCEGNSFYQK